MSKTTKEKIEVMQAYEEGKKIKCTDKYGGEVCIYAKFMDDKPLWDWIDYDYLIEEEPKYRPYKDTEEMINDFCERSGAKRSKMGEPFIWIKPYKNSKNRHLITDIYAEGVYNGATYLELEDMFRDYCYLDGTPIGKKE